MCKHLFFAGDETLTGETDSAKNTRRLKLKKELEQKSEECGTKQKFV
jgi:hypothetical protein